MDTTTNTWEDFEDMIVEMMEHAKNNGRAIVQHDFPLELKIGYMCENTGKIWEISLANIRRYKEKMGIENKEAGDIITRAFQQ